MRADMARALPDLDPTIRNQMVDAFIVAMGGRYFDAYQFLLQAVDQNFPQTSTGAYLRRWLGYDDLSPLPATVADGFYSVAGLIDEQIPDQTQVLNEGNIYLTQGLATISAQIFNITSLTVAGSTATAVTDAEHTLATGITATISGADQAEYNVSAVVTVLDKTTFQYQISGSPASPATGSPQVAFDGVSVQVISQSAGAGQNAEAGAPMEFANPGAFPNIDSIGFVGPDAISGGANAETDDEARDRLLFVRSNPQTNFNVSNIIATLKEIPGITRVFVKTATPNPGQVQIYFLRDGDDPIIPDAPELAEAKQKILDEIYPAHSDEADLFLIAPTPTDTDFVFGATNPSTASMQKAIRNSLKAFFEDEVEFETNVTEDAYRAAIINTIDDSGAKLQSFTLNDPSGDIVVAAGGIATLGQVTYT
jgi:uncharacterized phage protein gp47/JayE